MLRTRAHYIYRADFLVNRARVAYSGHDATNIHNGKKAQAKDAKLLRIHPSCTDIGTWTRTQKGMDES